MELCVHTYINIYIYALLKKICLLNIKQSYPSLRDYFPGKTGSFDEYKSLPTQTSNAIFITTCKFPFQVFKFFNRSLLNACPWIYTPPSFATYSVYQNKYALYAWSHLLYDLWTFYIIHLYCSLWLFSFHNVSFNFDFCFNNGAYTVKRRLLWNARPYYKMKPLWIILPDLYIYAANRGDKWIV